MNRQRIFYITETSLPSFSANIINSLKFCEALSEFRRIIFLLPKNEINSKKIFYQYNIRKKKIIFRSITREKITSKIKKLIFLTKIISYLKINKLSKDLVISRSILSSILLAFLSIKNVLEIHHDLTGLSKFLFKLLMLSKFKKNISFILINKNLVLDLNIAKHKYIILDDASDFKNRKKNSKYIKNTCVYVGSFYKGKGFETILRISKILPKVNFHLYGDASVLKVNQKKDLNKNIKIKNRINYRHVPKILSRYLIALMPYGDKIGGRSNNLEISRYISPLKMFDYLSAGNLIVASKLKPYSHVLKNNLNSFLVDNKKLVSWANIINKIFQNPKKYRKIRIEAVNTAKKYSWNNRAKKFIEFSYKI
ncbi:glycosyltransferase [Candidatus Pelagibacter sp.]|nr:glycosyltransferase [Candidatus Pelagibacter sp.]